MPIMGTINQNILSIHKTQSEFTIATRKRSKIVVSKEANTYSLNGQCKLAISNPISNCFFDKMSSVEVLGICNPIDPLFIGNNNLMTCKLG